MITEEQIRHVTDVINKKKIDASRIMNNMQNSSSVDFHNASLLVWLAGITEDGYNTLIERIDRM